jgi:hypothetical protein
MGSIVPIPKTSLLTRKFGLNEFRRERSRLLPAEIASFDRNVGGDFRMARSAWGAYAGRRFRALLGDSRAGASSRTPYAPRGPLAQRVERCGRISRSVWSAPGWPALSSRLCRFDSPDSTRFGRPRPPPKILRIIRIFIIYKAYSMCRVEGRWIVG